ncbi:hypothetical protein CIW50_07760 [Tardiphaga sp. P9-11]|nr:hypothetical protein CIW50_07760 [Tardiphaga sp. P9-11]
MIAIVTFAGWDAVDAGDAASREMWVTAVLRQAESSVVRIPLGQAARFVLRWKKPADHVTDDQVKTRSAYSLEAPCPFALGL